MLGYISEITTPICKIDAITLVSAVYAWWCNFHHKNIM